ATDEPSNNDSPDNATARQEAIDTLTDQGAFFFGIVPLSSSVETSFEPLATASGGSLFDLNGFITDPASVLNALLETCVEQVEASATSVDVHPTCCPNPFKLGKGGAVPAAILGSETL